MAKYTFDEIKNRKDFYRNYYYRFLTALFWLIIVILILIGVMAYFYFNYPEQRFYATNSVGFVDRLDPLDAPNNTAAPLQPDDPPSDNKRLPKNYNFDDQT